MEVLYDADCGFCQWCMNIVKKWDKKHQICLFPLQKPQYCQDFHVTLAEAASMIHAKDKSGNITAGALAVNNIMDTLWGTKFFTHLYSYRFIKRIQDVVYTVIARNRGHLPGSGSDCALS